MDATFRKITQQFSQHAYDRYVAQQVRGMVKARTQGHRDFVGWTDADIHDAAQHLARINNVGMVHA